MAFAVVAIHTHPLENCTNGFINNVFSNFFELAVPFFFVASGYLLALKISYPYEIEDISIIKQKLIKIVKMYIIWMIIYTPLTVFHNIKEGTSLSIFCLVYIKNLIFVGEQYNSWPLWYLLSTIYSLILIINLMRLKIKPSGMLIISLLFAFISFGTDWLSTTAMQLLAIFQLIQKVIKLSIYSGRIFRGMIYIPLGMILAQYRLNMPTNILMLVIGFVSRCYFENATIDSFLLILTVIGFWGIIEKIELPNSNIFRALRSASTAIYLIHMYIWSLYYFAVYKEKTYGMDSFLFTAIVSLILAFIYFYFLNNKSKKNI